MDVWVSGSGFHIPTFNIIESTRIITYKTNYVSDLVNEKNYAETNARNKK